MRTTGDVKAVEAAERRVRERAREVLGEAKISSYPISPEEVAKAVSLPIETANGFPPQAYGALQKVGNDFRVLVSTDCPSDGFRRFTISHELGHYHLDGHLEALFDGGTEKHFSDTGQFRGMSAPWYEREADVFASELLAPEHFAREVLRKSGRGLESVRAIADAFTTSLSCAAVRYAELADEGVAVILSYNGTIEWVRCSAPIREHWWGRRNLKGERAPGTSATAHMARAKARVVAAEEHSAEGWLNEWFEGAPSQSVEEETLGLGTYGRLLTVVYCGKIPSPDQEQVREERARRDPEDWREAMRPYQLDRYEDLADD